MTTKFPKAPDTLVMGTAEFRKKFKDAPFNPPERVKRRNLTDLIESIRVNKFQPTLPIQVYRDTIAEGHRRLYAAIYAESPYVYYTITDMPIQEYWAMVNGNVKAPSVKEAGTAVRLGLKVFPKNRARVLTQLQAISGDWKTMREILEKSSPGIVGPAQRVVNYCFDENDTSETKEEFTVTVIHWLIRHKQQTTVRHAIASGGITPETLFDRVVSDQPIIANYG